MNLDILLEGIHMFRRHLRVRGKHFRRLDGDATQICQQTLDELYTGYFYRTSFGNYPHFYARDFGMVVKALLFLRKRKEVVSTLRYALEQYKEFGAIKTFITILGKPLNFPSVYSLDSTAYMLYALALVDDKDLVDEFKDFLQEEVNKFYEVVVDKDTGLPKRRKHFGSMRDHSKRDASCYDAVMCAVVQREAKRLGLSYEGNYDYRVLIVKNYWTGKFFRDDLVSDHLSADACIYPFWLGIIDDKKMLRTTIQSIQDQKLDIPFPIKYVQKDSGHKIFEEIFVPGWQDNSVWPMSGLPFIEVVSMVDKERAKKYLKQYKEKIEEHATFIEVYAPDGKPYKSWFFSADEGMLWCANYLFLENLINYD